MPNVPWLLRRSVTRPASFFDPLGSEADVRGIKALYLILASGFGNFQRQKFYATASEEIQHHLHFLEAQQIGVRSELPIKLYITRARPGKNMLEIAVLSNLILPNPHHRIPNSSCSWQAQPGDC